MFNAEAELEQEQARREAVVVEAARRYATAHRAFLTASNPKGRYHAACARDYAASTLLDTAKALEELTGPLQETQP